MNVNDTQMRMIVMQAPHRNQSRVAAVRTYVHVMDPERLQLVRVNRSSPQQLILLNTCRKTQSCFKLRTRNPRNE